MTGGGVGHKRGQGLRGSCLRRNDGGYVSLNWSRMLGQSLPEPPPLLATMVPSRPMPTYVACERMLKACCVPCSASAKIQS